MATRMARAGITIIDAIAHASIQRIFSSLQF